MKKSVEDIKGIIERLKNNRLIKRFCVCNQAYDLIEEEYKGLEYYKDQYRGDYDWVEEDVIRENDEKYIELLEKLENLQEAQNEMGSRFSYIGGSWQFEQTQSILRKIITEYDLWDVPELVDIIERLGIEKNDEEEKGEQVSDEKIEEMMGELEECAESLLDDLCLEDLEEESDYPVDEIMREFTKKAKKLFERGPLTIMGIEAAKQAISNLKNTRTIDVARELQQPELTQEKED